MKQFLLATGSFVLLTGFVHLPTNITQPKPPKEAFEACEGLSEGQSCEVKIPGQTVSGTCRTMPGQQQRFCVPQGGPMGGQMAGPGAGPMSGPGKGNGRPRIRRHTTIQSDGVLDLKPATIPPITESEVAITLEGDCRKVVANGISEHKTGPFPNDGNPSFISEQGYSFCLPGNPEKADVVTPLVLGKFGIGLNGVPFDPGAAEFYLGNPRNGWRYEALSGALNLGLDENHAHVQPDGSYHYHGLPSLHLEGIQLSSTAHSPQIGWAADGFPIYALFGYEDKTGANSAIMPMTSSYRLKSGSRPSQGDNPGGTYDGTFVADYEYVEGQGALDRCNGRFAVTPEFPEGTYAYYLTAEWPVIPRCFSGTPSEEFIAVDLPPGSPEPR